MRVALLFIVGTGLVGLVATVAMRVGDASNDPELIAEPSNCGVGFLIVEPNPEMSRMIEKERIAARVAVGELGLMEAVELVQGIYGGEPNFLRGMRSKYPHASDVELCALNVIQCVGVLLINRPERETRLDRLHTELNWFKEFNPNAM